MKDVMAFAAFLALVILVIASAAMSPLGARFGLGGALLTGPLVWVALGVFALVGGAIWWSARGGGDQR